VGECGIDEEGIGMGIGGRYQRRNLHLRLLFLYSHEGTKAVCAEGGSKHRRVKGSRLWCRSWRVLRRCTDERHEGDMLESRAERVGFE